MVGFKTCPHIFLSLTVHEISSDSSFLGYGLGFKGDDIAEMMLHDF